jgi:hypothetical protein
MTEAEIREHLEQVKHHMYMEKCESWLVRLELRTRLLGEQAREAIAAGTLTDADVTLVRSKWEAFKGEFAALKAAGGTSTKASRAGCTHAWDELRTLLRATRERAGLSALASASPDA